MTERTGPSWYLLSRWFNSPSRPEHILRAVLSHKLVGGDDSAPAATEAIPTSAVERLRGSL